MKKYLKGKKGITLISLVITVIIMIILSGVTIFFLQGTNLFEKVDKASEFYEQSAKEEYNTINNILGVLPKDIEGLNVNVENEDIYYIGKILDFDSKYGISKAFLNGEKIENGYEIKQVGTYVLRLVDDFSNEVNIKFYVNDGLVALIKDKNLEDGVQDVIVNDVKYSINLVNYKGDLVLDGVSQNNVSNLNTNTKTYEIGELTDVATSSEYAKNTVVLKVDGNLTVQEGVTLTAIKSEQGYGGPKGLFICVDGKIINNGTISMTARGAKAEGQNVYLWQNTDGNYEYIPAVGAEGGKNTSLLVANKYNSTWKIYNISIGGLPGKSVDDGRGLGGGAAGYAYFEGKYSGSVKGYMGNGANATSYSGGSGGGAIAYINSNTSNATYYGASAQDNGGAGGRGNAYDGVASWYRYASGGAGNPGGKGYYESTQRNDLNGNNGTGGLLIMYADSVENNGAITSKGSNCKSISVSGNSGMYTGGASGGGSVNVFFKENVIKGNILVAGGSSNDKYRKGGDGSISVGKIIDGKYVENVE